jgi:hypothetical protein
MKYLRCCRRTTSTQPRSGVAPRAVQGANQSTARPFLSTDGEILAPFGASCDRADLAIFLALSTSEQVTIICELPYLKQAAGRPVLFGSRDDATFLLKCFRCGTFNRFTYRSHTSRSMSLHCERSVWRSFFLQCREVASGLGSSVVSRLRRISLPSV